MTTQELLEQILRLTKTARWAQEQEQRWRQNAYRLSGGFPKPLGQSNAPDCRHERALLESHAAHSEATQLTQALQGLRALLAPMLQALPPSQMRAALRYRYLEGLTCTQMACHMHYSRPHIYRLLEAGRAALDALPQQET